MSKSPPLVQDRVIPIPPSLALCLAFLPGVDDRDARNKARPRTSHLRKNKDGEVLGVKESNRGLTRAAVLVQLNHRLVDSAITDRRLAVVGGQRWYARSYAEWKMWDFPFIPAATLTKAFQDMETAGIILARSDRLLLDADPTLASRKELMRLLSVYNRKAFSIDYERLAELMAADARVQQYFATMFKPESAAEQAEGSDQDDQTVRSGRSDSLIRMIEPSDQGDQTVRSGRSEGSDHPDQRSSESESASDQTRSESSSASGAAPPPEPDSGTGDDPPGPSLAPGLGYTKAYGLLTKYGVNANTAEELAKTASPDRIEAWLDYIYLPKSGRKPIENKAGYLISMIKQENAWPPGHKRNAAEQATPEPGRRFLSGPLGREVNH